MKKTLFTLIITLISYCSYAQNSPLVVWGTGLDGSTYQRAAILSDATNGLLIEAPLNPTGTKLPITLSWRGGGSPFVITPTGNVGIGATDISSLLTVGSATTRGTLSINGGTDVPQINLTDKRSGGHIYSLYSGASANGNFDIFDQTTAATRLVINSSGNVGIGTTDPKGYKLAIAGNVIAESVTVKLQGSWPDYVFRSDYDLPSLAEVRSYIDQNYHLPDVPSAQQVAKDGLNLGEMNATLLKKIEELTLYLIEKDKQVKDLQDEMKRFKMQQGTDQIRLQQENSKQQNTRIAALEAALSKLLPTK